MIDFTLVIPTFNRQARLNALLDHLAAQHVTWPIVVADSGETPWEGRVVGSLQIGLGRYPSDTHPFAKFWHAVGLVKTEFCALCGDDDVVLPEGVVACVEALKDTPTASVARGMEFAFHPESRNEIMPYVRKGISIVDGFPLRRLDRYFEHYECCTYGVYRTAALKDFLGEAMNMTSLLGRELLSGSLAAISGEMLEVRVFNHGRSMCQGAQRYWNWHPVEWFLNDLEGLAAEYLRFKAALTKRLALPDEDLPEALDRIFTRYFWMHKGPVAGLEFHKEALLEATDKEKRALKRALKYYRLG